jgi:ribosomal protein S12 methylthiotransferase
MARVHFVSLGCPKNRVDAEHMLGITLASGHELVDTPEEADAIVVNTCSFIGEAKKESIETILEMGEIKAVGGQKLIVSGCLAQRYVGELEGEMPEVDHFLGTSDYRAISLVLGGNASAAAADESGFVPLASLSKKGKSNAKRDAGVDELVQIPRIIVGETLDYVAGCDLPRVNSMPRHTAYLKIAEGCDNTCAFCIIPTLRGKQRSRTIEDLVREAKHLAASGTKELILIAQDLTGYGHDLDGRPKLSDLLNALADVDGIRWVRCMYAYPRTLSGALMHALDSGKNILPYLDIPVQHGSDRMLRLMRRGKDQTRLKELLLSVRNAVRNLVLRSTVIVGFPGETDEDYEKLVDFAEAIRFERLGVFKYSDEEGTAAYDLPDRVVAKTKRARFDKLMRRQKKIHREKLTALIGTVHEAIVEGQSDEHEYLVVGRLWSQAPEIDGITYLSSTRALTAGDIVHVVITDAHDYDVVAEVLDDDDERIVHSVPFEVRKHAPIAQVGPAMRG